MGSGFVAASDGSFYLLDSSGVNIDGISNAGAVTWVNGSTGRSLYGLYGTVSSQNSIVGGSASSGLGTPQIDAVNDSFISEFSADTSNSSNGRVRIGIYDPNSMTFERAQGQDMSILPEFLTTFLNAGTDVEIQANNDIAIDSAVTVSNPGGDGGNLTLTAGRSVAMNADVATDNGDFTVSANDPSAVSAERDAGNADIDIAAGVTISTGTGNLTLEIQGTTDSGSITLGTGSTLTASTGDILLIAGADIIASGAATITTTGNGDITLVVDNAFPTSPSFGPGLFDIAGLAITSGGIVQLYAGAFGLGSFPPTINGTPYTPGSGVNERGSTYYPSGIGGAPFTVFYKTAIATPSPGPTDEQRNRGKFRYFSAMSEAFLRWTPYSIQGVEGYRIYAPMGTGLIYFFPYSLVEYERGDELIFEKRVGIQPRRFIRSPSWKKWQKKK